METIEKGSTQKVAMTVHELLDQIGGLRDPYTCGIVISMGMLWLLSAISIMAPAFISPFEKNLNDTPFVTVQDEFKLENSWINPAEWTGSMIFVGNLIAGQFLALITDYYGRRHVVAISALFSGFTGIASALSPSFNLLLFTRFLTGVFFTAAFVTNYVLAAECLPLSSHSICSLIFGLMWVTGYCLVSPVALLFAHWRHFLAAASAPLAIFGFFLILALPESLLYSVSKQDADAIRAYLKNVERFSKKKLKYNLKAILQNDGDTSAGKNLKAIIGDLFQKDVLTNVLLSSYLWTAVYFVYNGMSFASTVLNVGNNHVQYILSGLIEVPSYFLSPLLFDRLGRRFTVIILSLSGSVLHFVMGIMTIFSLETSTIFMCVWLLAKLSASGVFLCLFIYGAEIFPVSCRSAALGLCSTLSNFGAIAAPHAPALGTLFSGATSFAFGLLFFIGSITTKFLPETSHLH
ncbi:unnamed protein product, partial [Mesorhabditis belari]|uniref:Major facilitator superfamily (MFS) profile domain-containing protein n=1 Tax=Mesorhabditis belari TaxID=2138241 RepID=A0AAF3FH31_9BILA